METRTYVDNRIKGGDSFSHLDESLKTIIVQPPLRKDNTVNHESVRHTETKMPEMSDAYKVVSYPIINKPFKRFSNASDQTVETKSTAVQTTLGMDAVDTYLKANEQLVSVNGQLVKQTKEAEASYQAVYKRNQALLEKQDELNDELNQHKSVLTPENIEKVRQLWTEFNLSLIHI